jgi:regulator of protease activity HflC (stomatin/prohibitin superfamily)
MRQVVVWDFEVGLLYVNGRLQGTLGPGRYWETAWLFGQRRIVAVDTRLRTVSIPGQEVLTSDQVNIRLTIAIEFRVVDPVKAVQEVQSYYDTLHVDAQMPLRALVGSMTLDQLLQAKDSLDEALLGNLAPRAASYGVEVSRAAIKDVILPGELRTIMNRVVEAKKTAEAALLSAREEVATARARQNVAAMIRENPTMLELLRLEAAKEMAKGRGNTIIFGNPPPVLSTPDGQT